MSEILSNEVMKFQSTFSLEKLVSTKYSTELGYGQEIDIQYTDISNKVFLNLSFRPEKESYQSLRTLIRTD